ncbi:MAG: DUF2226 domain-containing protein [Candidatus Hydrothermarchaeota archaeon]
MQKLGLIARVLCKSKVTNEIYDLDVDNFFKILRVMVENSYSGHLKVTSPKSDLETWMIFRNGVILEVIAVKKGYEEGDILEFMKEYPVDEFREPFSALGDILSSELIEIKIYETDMKINEKIDYFLERVSSQAEFYTISNLIENVTPYVDVDLSPYKMPENVSKNLSRSELLKKYRLKLPEEKFIDRILEQAGFDFGIKEKK